MGACKSKQLNKPVSGGIASTVLIKKEIDFISNHLGRIESTTGIHDGMEWSVRHLENDSGVALNNPDIWYCVIKSAEHSENYEPELFINMNIEVLMSF